jgi:hypothetical protein
MKNIGKIFVIFLTILALTSCFTACAAEETADDTSTDSGGEIVDDSQTPSQGNLTEINIYLYGLKTPVTVGSTMGVFLANALNETIEAVGDTSALLTDNSGISAEDLMNTYTCLELIYDGPVDLPLTQSGENCQASRVLYAIFAGENGANILFTGRDSYYPSSMGAIADMSLANTLEQYAKNDVQKAVFSDDVVTVAGITMDYLADQSADIEEPLLSQMLYNAVAFYENCYKKNFIANTFLMTEGLISALDDAANNIASDNSHGEDIILQMDNYFDYRVPETAQVVYDGHLGDYFVYLSIDGINTLQLVFLNIDGYPYVESCFLMSV